MDQSRSAGKFARQPRGCARGVGKRGSAADAMSQVGRYVNEPSKWLAR